MKRINSIVYHMIILFVHSVCSSGTASRLQNKQQQHMRQQQLSVKINCTRDAFNIKLDMDEPFRGLVFAKDFVDECRVRGDRTTSIEINLPASGCGVRSEPKPGGSLELSVRLVIQMDEKLRQQTDMERTVRCSLSDDLMEMNIVEPIGSNSKQMLRHGRKQFGDNEESSSKRIRVWLELGGNDGGSGIVEVGQPTTLGVKAILPASIGVRIIDCAALDGLGDSSQKLLDERGCPVDEQVMPALLTQLRPLEEGWSKPHVDDLVEKLFTSTFPAFKFPDRERLHISCGVQLCRSQCPLVDCKTEEPFVLDGNEQLARIEVFNSLAVTAPQIELDRRFNGTVDEYASTRLRTARSDGILCLSSSKLALAFCMLGTIFLIAVIVAICCLIGGKSNSSRWMNGTQSVRGTTTSVFSSSCSSHSRFGSKLLLPYGESLPYGRVY